MGYDWRAKFNGGYDEERDQPHAKTEFIKLKGHLEQELGRSLQNHEVLEEARKKVK